MTEVERVAAVMRLSGPALAMPAGTVTTSGGTAPRDASHGAVPTGLRVAALVSAEL